MSIALIHIHWNNLRGPLAELLPVIRPYITGNQPKISKWRLMETSEADHHEEKQDLLVFIIVGKRGKMEERNANFCATRGACCLLPGWSPTFVRQWSNGKGRFRKRPFFYIWWWDRYLRSTPASFFLLSGLWLAKELDPIIFYHFYGTESSPGSP